MNQMAFQFIKPKGMDPRLRGDDATVRGWITPKNRIAALA